MARQVGEQLGEPDAVLVFDPSAFAKSGKHSFGVARQWCGRLGKVDNCQLGVYLAYVSSLGHTLVDCDLYLPEEWTKDKPRMKKAGVPKTLQKHRSRHQICLDLLDRSASFLPYAWITGDDEMGRPTWFRRELHGRNEQYLLAVPSNTAICDLEIPEPIYSGRGRPGGRPSLRMEDWANSRPTEDWQRVDVRDGEKGPLVVEAMKCRVETTSRGEGISSGEMMLIVRYKHRDNHNVVKRDFYLSNAAQETDIAEFCRVALAEHRVEECIKRCKSEVGLADYEVRTWEGWQHHQMLSLLANWFLLDETRRAEKNYGRKLGWVSLASSSARNFRGWRRNRVARRGDADELPASYG